AGFEVIYGGIRLAPEEIVQAAVEEDVTVIGLSVLSGAHVETARLVLEVPERDFERLRRLGVKAIFTPRDFDLMAVMDRVLDVIGAPAAAAAEERASA